MCVIQCAGHRRGDPHRLIHRKLLLPIDAVAERLALHIGHHIEEEAVRLSRIVQRQDVGVLELRRGLDLGQEAFGTDDGSEFRLQDFEGDLALVLEVIGQVDRCHAALAELTLDGVATLQGDA